MTYTQAIHELQQSAERYPTLTHSLIASFLDIERVPLSKIALREREIEDLCAVLVNHLLTAHLPKKTRLELMDLIEQLRLALDMLAVRSGKVTIEEIAIAGGHMAKKMQSSFPDPTNPGVPKRTSTSNTKFEKTGRVPPELLGKQLVPSIQTTVIPYESSREMDLFASLKRKKRKALKKLST